jgi:hypothetical protein
VIRGVIRTSRVTQTVGSIRFQFEPDADGTGKLVVTAVANGFAGVGAAWFNAADIEAFASKLAAYPLVESGVAIAGGFFDDRAQDVPSQEHVGVRVYRVGGRGQVAVQVRLATEVREHTRPESRHATKLELLTTYERLGRFARDLLAVVKGDTPAAVLAGEALG